MSALGSLWVVVLLAQLPPAAPTPAYPATDGATRDKYKQVSVDTAPADITRSQFEFRRQDAGFVCEVPAACPGPHTSAPFESQSASSLPEERWCFRARFENDAGSSPFSIDRCFLEDRTDPPAPLFVDAGFSQGLFTMHYQVLDEPQVDASGIERCCAAAVDLDTGVDFSPYCSQGAPWVKLGALDFVLTLPVPPGRWSPAVSCHDRADNTSARTFGAEATNVAGGAAPPPPFWRLNDGGAGPDDLWTNDTYLSRVTFPGTATSQWTMMERRDEDGGWSGIDAERGQNTGASMYVRYDPPRKLVRYSVLEANGVTSPYSPELRVRYDNVAPSDLTGCTASVSGDAVQLSFSGGVDARSSTSFDLHAVNVDGGSLRLVPSNGAVTLPEGTWTLSLDAEDEARNRTATSCGVAVIDLTGPMDAGTTDAGASDAGPSGPPPWALTVGCGCASPGAPWWLGVLWLVRARRRQPSMPRASSRR